MIPPADANGAWVNDRNVALLVDFYELTMVQAYWRERMFEEAVFSLFAPALPAQRNYLLVCGLDDALRYLENFHFDSAALDLLRTRKEFSAEFLNWLRDLRFTGDVFALPKARRALPMNRSLK